ncbi:MAG: glycosyltransferase [Betaproteobacteria bacterium]|jgi:glycosyltransferase involved in cell wall biosynthesis
MRFLFIHQNFPAQFVHLAPALVGQGHEVVALGTQRPRARMPGVRVLNHRPVPPAPADAQGDGFTQEWAAKRARAESAAAAMTALKTEGFMPDVVFGHPGWGEMLYARDVFPSSRHLVFAEYYYGTDGGDSFFDPEFQRGPPDLAALQRVRLKNTHLLHALASCDEAVAPTAFQKSRHPAAFLDRIRVIHDGIDTDLFQPNPQASVKLQQAGVELKPGDEVVTFVARQLEPYRGYHSFMRSLQRLQRLRPHARVVIVGGNDTAYGAQPPAGQTWKGIFLDEVKDALDMTRVHFVGQLPHPVLQQLLQVSAVHTYLTYPFVLSWSMLEAMSQGALLVASRTAPVQEVIEHGHNGLLVDFFDHQALADTLADALERRAELQPLRQAARQTVVQRYDLRRVCLPAMLAFAQGGPGKAHADSRSR